jgi:hypothetical protein
MMLLVAFGILLVVEMKTLLAMVGFDLSAEVYYPVATTVLIAALASLLLLPPKGNPSRT